MKSLIEHLDAFLAHAEAIHQSPVHRRVLRFSILRMLRWLATTFGVVDPGQLTAGNLDGWFKHVSTRRTRKGVPLKTTSVSKQLQGDRCFVQWLEKTGAVPAGLHEALPPVKIPDLLPTSVLDHPKMVRLLDRVDRSSPQGHQLSAMMEVLYSTGVRIAELLGMDTGSVDLTSGLIRVRGKGDKERVVPVGTTALNRVESYLKGVRPNLQTEPGQTALWLDRGGSRMPYHTFRRLLHGAVEEAQIKLPVTAHTFRRSCATELIRGGANLRLVADLFGHESVETLKPYVRLTIVDLKKTHKKCHPRERNQPRPE